MLQVKALSLSRARALFRLRLGLYNCLTEQSRTRKQPKGQNGKREKRVDHRKRKKKKRTKQEISFQKITPRYVWCGYAQPSVPFTMF